MAGYTNSIIQAGTDSNWCNPIQHARDEHAFVQMLVVCAVAWLAWRLYRRFQRHNELPRIPRRRPPGAPGA